MSSWLKPGLHAMSGEGEDGEKAFGQEDAS
jgi:hypothetical protein